MNTNKALIASGFVGALVAALCCATPLLVVLFGTVGLTAWLANASYVVIPAILICLALVIFGVSRRRRTRP